ncbi:MAG: DUF3488 and transglutaminase-like domain-containing protein [Gammaproteobacteria bacterium]
MATDRRSDGRLLDTLPWTLGALGLALVPHVGALPLWIVLLAILCGVWRWIVERRRTRLPWRGLRFGLAFGGFLAVIFTYGGINGVGPGTALLVIMASLKLLETRTRRDQFVLMFIAVFLVLAALLREPAPWTLPYLFAALFAIVAAWLNAGRGGNALPPMLAARSAGRLLAQALPLMLVFWILFPRVPGPFWAIPTEQGGAVTGLSDRMSPGDITRLGRSNALAFRVWFDDDPPPPARRYWRGIVMDRVIDGRTWAARPLRYEMLGRDPVEPRGEPVRYRIRLAPTNQRYLFMLERVADWSAPGTFVTSRLEVASTAPVDDWLTYEARSYPEARADLRLSDEARSDYTALPENANPRTREYARRLRTGSGDERDYIRRVLAYYRQNSFSYTLTPSRLGRDAVDEFLFTSRAGFCEHYATSFATLMRAAGIPARVVAGYQGGELNPIDPDEAYYIVRQSDAHAWTEVWLDGEGWRRVDPTAAVAPDRIRSGLYDAVEETEFGVADRLLRSSTMETLRFYWDLTNARWDEWVLGYGPATQRDFLRWLGMDEPGWRRMLVWLTALLAVLLAALSGWLAWRHRRPRADRAARLYRRFTEATGLQRAAGEPPLDYAERAADALPAAAGEIRRITALYLDSRYAGMGREDELAAAVRGFAVKYPVLRLRRRGTTGRRPRGRAGSARR